MIHFPKKANPEIEAWLSHQKELKAGSYDSDEILVQLAKDFKNKCYICEDTVKSIRIEHFRPKVLGKDQEFDWFNLFNACDHCNAIKSDDYRNLIDCTQDYPDRKIKFEVNPMNPLGEQVVITQIDTQVHEDTINLLNAVYRGTNKRKQLEAQNIVTDLLEELNDFDDLITDYLESPEQHEIDDIRDEVNNESKFTAFKRWFVLNNPEYKEKFQPLFEDEALEEHQ
ncbi:hypothetical protein C1N32_03975 [Vibrio diazotrophicus]|uniref:HNH endonuclease n=1 Tax=Vibrio diazotrophicus TaxID=685 RepID=A0A2J8I6K8_VIBDI|nr:hypothetical protein [Vibrio diazotrophicus]PNI06165.1 hypothetical protein C1N32_03975 [Vibrio diazotrophicus]